MPAATDGNGLVKINREELAHNLHVRGKTYFDLKVVSAGTRAKIRRGEKVKVSILRTITAQLAAWPVLEGAAALLSNEVR